MSYGPLRFDEDGKKRYELAKRLMNGKRELIPYAVRTALGGYGDLTPVTNPALRNHLAHALENKLQRAATDIAKQRMEKAEQETFSPSPYLPIVLLDD